MSDRIELLLSEILAELQQHHAYVRERDARLDTEDAEQERAKAERNAKMDAMLLEQNQIAKSAFSKMDSPSLQADAELLSAVNAPYFAIANYALAEKLILCLSSDVQNCGRAAMVLALQEAHQNDEWGRFQPLFAAAKEYLDKYPPEAVGWNDFWMARWLILHDPKAIGEITRRTAQSGPVGDTARWMVSSVASLIPQFAEDLQREQLMSQAPAGGNA